MPLGIIFTFLWPLSRMPGCDKKEVQLQLRYRTIRRKKEMDQEKNTSGLKMVKQMDGDKDENVDEIVVTPKNDNQ